MGNNNFEIDFQSEEEIQEMLDCFVGSIGEAIETDEEKVSILNPMKMQAIQFSYGILKYLSKNTEATISYALNEPFKSMGSVSVEGKCLTFTNSEWFARAAEFASSTEIYPLVNGKVRMTLTFHGLTIPIE